MYDVLIVEDDPMVAVINKQYVMNNSSFRVCGTCKDGLSALEFLKNEHVDLIILDQYMPRMTGLEFLQEIRKNGIPVQVIMVTAANDSPSVEEALRLGIVDYLVKPFSNARFNQALMSFMARTEAFKDKANVDQYTIDGLLAAATADLISELPKGIQKTTLDRIISYLTDNENKELTGEEISEAIGLSTVTVRRYMNYLISRHEVTSHMNYETGGRPKMIYRSIIR